MRAPPPVAVDIAAPRGWRMVQALAFAAAAACVAAWGVQHLIGSGAASALAMAGAAAAAALLGGALGWRLARGSALRLAWTGQGWTCRQPAMDEALAVRPSVSLDLGGWMLLRLTPERGAVIWASVARGDAGADWHPLRAALYCAPTEPPP